MQNHAAVFRTGGSSQIKTALRIAALMTLDAATNQNRGHVAVELNGFRDCRIRNRRQEKQCAKHKRDRLV